ncbi:RNA-binding domain-containing protein [Neoconidiobolus thromboides FSU 785]|nr:RNA-binding domain-containing protein [Neoconidiobolus thromboides FSU 785]
MAEIVSKTFGGPEASKQPITAAEAELELQRKVFVAKLPHDATEAELEEYFGQVGSVQRVIIVTKNNEATGYGFVTYSEIANLDQAIKKLNKINFKGKRLSIEQALPKKELQSVRRNRTRNRGSKGPGSKPIRSKGGKLDWAEDVEEQNIVDLVKKGPPPHIKGRRFPIPHAHHKIEGEASSNTIFVGNLGTDINENKFVEIFKDLKIEKAWLARREYPPFMVKGFGFIQLETVEEQQKVLESASTRTYNGRQLQMRTAILPKSDQSTTTEKPVSKPSKEKIQEVPTEASWPPLSSTKQPNGVVTKPIENNTEVAEEKVDEEVKKAENKVDDDDESTKEINQKKEELKKEVAIEESPATEVSI